MAFFGRLPERVALRPNHLPLLFRDSVVICHLNDVGNMIMPVLYRWEGDVTLCLSAKIFISASLQAYSFQPATSDQTPLLPLHLFPFPWVLLNRNFCSGLLISARVKQACRYAIYFPYTYVVPVRRLVPPIWRLLPFHEDHSAGLSRIICYRLMRRR